MPNDDLLAAAIAAAWTDEDFKRALLANLIIPPEAAPEIYDQVKHRTLGI